MLETLTHLFYGLMVSMTCVTNCPYSTAMTSLPYPDFVMYFLRSRQQVERERRVRREIANSNERRRMQSINQGYNCLKSMLPLVDGGEKLSKVTSVNLLG